MRFPGRSWTFVSPSLPHAIIQWWTQADVPSSSRHPIRWWRLCSSLKPTWHAPQEITSEGTRAQKQRLPRCVTHLLTHPRTYINKSEIAPHSSSQNDPEGNSMNPTHSLIHPSTHPPTNHRQVAPLDNTTTTNLLLVIEQAAYNGDLARARVVIKLRSDPYKKQSKYEGFADPSKRKWSKREG